MNNRWSQIPLSATKYLGLSMMLTYRAAVGLNSTIYRQIVQITTNRSIHKRLVTTMSIACWVSMMSQTVPPHNSWSKTQAKTNIHTKISQNSCRNYIRWCPCPWRSKSVKTARKKLRELTPSPSSKTPKVVLTMTKTNWTPICSFLRGGLLAAELKSHRDLSATTSICWTRTTENIKWPCVRTCKTCTIVTVSREEWSRRLTISILKNGLKNTRIIKRVGCNANG